MLSRCIDVVSWSTSGDAKGRQVEVRPERRTTVEPEARKSHAATTATTEGAHGARLQCQIEPPVQRGPPASRKSAEAHPSFVGAATEKP